MSTDVIGTVLSVNVGAREPNPASNSLDTGIHKKPVDHAVDVRAPGVRGDGPGSGLVGDYIGDDRHHGGDHQAVYAFSRDELDFWEKHLGRSLGNGAFGENLTIAGYDLDRAILGEIWRIGQIRLQVTAGRTPCRTFAAVLEEQGWVKTFTRRGRTGAYLMVLEPGRVRSGMDVELEFRPDHGITVEDSFRATSTHRRQLSGLLAAEPYLVHPTLRSKVYGALDRDL